MAMARLHDGPRRLAHWTVNSLQPQYPRGRALLLGVDLPRSQHKATEPVIATEESLAELARLAETAGYEPVRVITQRRDAPDPAHFVGSGKIDEIRAAAEESECDVLLFDHELSGIQARNLEEGTGLRVLDRTQLILEIFAARAQSKEGRLQVDLARLMYELPRLTGHGAEMSRLGASAGQYTRGPGETRLEADRRVIRSRLSDLRKEIEELRKHRSLHRQSRRRIPMPVISVVGYTNAGKSTLLNALTGSEVLAEDKLFATLDPTTRGVDLPGGGRALVTDTVGFIRRLPHQLVAAFRATLEEVAEADLLIHVIDASSPIAAEQATVVRTVLTETGAADVPVIVALNKADALDAADAERLRRLFPGAVLISALTGAGLDDLLEAVSFELRQWREDVHLVIPYDSSDLAALLHETGEVRSETFGPAGVEIHASVDRGTAARVRKQLAQKAAGRG